MAEAMAQVRGDLGPEALILSTRRIGEGVELTAALDQDDEAVPPPAAVDLGYHGIPEPLAARLGGPDLAAGLAGLLRFEALPAWDPVSARPLLLAGLPGAGKTLSIARLATRMVLSGTSPVVITADGRRAGAAEELAAYTRLLGLELMVAGTPQTLARALAAPACRGGAPILIDTSGINPFEQSEISALTALAQAADAVPVLVMSAGQHPGESVEQAQAFAALGVRHLLPTRLDLVRRLGSIIAAAAAADLALTEAGIGPGATDALVAITPAFLAGRLVDPGAPRSPAAPNRVPSQPHRRPVFPTARAHEAASWSIERHG